ncbi:uncharacterized protein LOC143236374 [Tachypleus tridentatus]|uniref:uncharacterized protein LOC143236374 n=1 Tax=Tachypleus tridentatus TaxID=6853 RepID=UPI003FCFC0DC
MASKNRYHCRNKPDAFCYICGCYALNRQRRNISSFVKRAYKAYFEIHIGDQDKQWAPHVVCHNCEEMLRDWTKGKRNGLPFGVPMIWREPTNHVTDCYFCMVNTTGVGKKNRHKRLRIRTFPSAIQPAPHSEEVPVPVFKGLPSLDDKDIGHDTSEQDSCDSELSEKCTQSENCSSDTEPFPVPKPLPQAELNDLVRDLGLSNKNVKLHKICSLQTKTDFRFEINTLKLTIERSFFKCNKMNVPQCNQSKWSSST